MASDLLYRNVGTVQERPFSILAHTLETTLGDLVSKAIFFATIKRQFEHARLHVCYRNVRPYSSKVLSLVPGIDLTDTIKGELPAWIRSYFKRDRLWRPLTLDARKGNKRRFYDFYINDWMADSRSLHALPDIVPLQVPAELGWRLERRLLERGLDRSRWFAVIHHRDSSYAWRKNIGGLRDSDPEAFRELVDFIIEELGGQVVRLGHPEMEALPERPGFVDLSRDENRFMLQAYAVSRARFMVAGPSGTVSLGWGFQIPTATVDATDAQGGWGEVERVMLTHEVQTPDGRRLRNRALFEAGLLSRAPLAGLLKSGKGYCVRKCTGGELSAVAVHLHAKSGDVDGWREPAPVVNRPAKNVLSWPPQTFEDLPFLDVSGPCVG